MAGAIKTLLKKLGYSRRIAEGMAMIEWPHAVGATIGRHTRPVAVRRGVLFVQVQNPVWATQLSFMKTDLIQRINDRLGQRIIVDIQWVGGSFGKPYRTLRCRPGVGIRVSKRAEY